MIKKTIILLLVLGFVSCTNDDLELNNNLKTIDLSNLDMQACDCGIHDLGGGGSNEENNSSDNHIFESYDYYGDVTITGYDYPAYEIYSKSLLKFSFGINLNGNGKIIQSTIGNISPKSGVTILHYNSNNMLCTFLLKVKGKRWAMVNGEWKKVTAYANVNLSIPTAILPTLSGEGNGGTGVFPYNQ